MGGALGFAGKKLVNWLVELVVVELVVVELPLQCEPPATSGHLSTLRQCLIPTQGTFLRRQWLGGLWRRRSGLPEV
jgi:hypothetical protein